MSRRSRGGQPFSLFAFQDIITSVTGIIVLVMLILSLELLQRKPNTPDLDSHALLKQVQRALHTAHEEQIELQEHLQSDQAAVLAAAQLSPTELEHQRFQADRQLEQLERELAELAKQNAQAARDRGQLDAKLRERGGEVELVKQSRAEAAEAEAELAALQQTNRVIYNVPPDSEKTAWLVDISAARVLAAPVGERRRPLCFEATGGLFETAPLLAWAEERRPDREYFILFVRPDGLAHFKDLRAGLRARGFDLGFDLIPQGATVLDPETGAGR